MDAAPVAAAAGGGGACCGVCVPKGFCLRSKGETELYKAASGVASVGILNEGNVWEDIV